MSRRKSDSSFSVPRSSRSSSRPAPTTARATPGRRSTGASTRSVTTPSASPITRTGPTPASAASTRSRSPRTSTSMKPPPPSRWPSSSSVPWATSSPSLMTRSRSHVWLISGSRWLETSTVCSAPRSPWMSVRISTICRGSSPLPGSSSSSSAGRWTSACATPTRCR
ncbi:hypothetical protein [Archangium gephyra]|uniref:hypothetical protein n=1 Tax=Archangium gephyra TaxID=48 RepID=UPI001FE0A1CF|nr:hypothetical protein [Archangium gephyra]